MKQKRTKNKLLIILLSLACIGALTYGTYAAFSTSGNFKRAVVARTKDAEDSNALRFSSNYLNPVEINENKYGIVPVSVDGDNVTIGVTVCNYPQTNSSLTNTVDITYTIAIKILDSSFNILNEYENNITIDPSSGKTLKSGSSSAEVHRIIVPSNLVSEISTGYIQIVVTPNHDSLSATNNQKLAANIKIIPAANKETAWTCMSGDSADVFESLDAYNCQISGTEQCNLKLSWKKELVSLSDWSIKTLKPDVDESEITKIKSAGSITFSVGGQDQPTSYMLQFYKVVNQQLTSFENLGISLTKQ